MSAKLVRVGDRVRVTIEGTVQYSSDSLLEVVTAGLTTSLFPSVPTGVEVLEPAVVPDPPLEPGDLVRDGDGLVWQLVSLGRFTKVFLEDGFASWNTSLATRDKLNGPLVKVRLVDVSDD